MQGSTKDCLPMEEHTRGGDAPTVLAIEWTHRGGPNEQTHISSKGGGRTHNVTQRTDTQFFFLQTKRNETNETNETNGQSHILRQHAA